MVGIWTATYVHTEGDEVRAFGNIGGVVVSCIGDAINLIENDMEEVKHTYGDVKSEVRDYDHNRFEIDFKDGNSFIWEPQNMNCDNLCL